MIHARSVRLATVIILGGAVALATSACGGPMQAGAAAVIDGQRVTDATIQNQVASIVAMDQRYAGAQGDATDAGRTQFAQAQIQLLMQQALWQKAADDQGITVTAADDAKVHSSLVKDSRQFMGKQFTGSDNEAVAIAVASQSSQQGQSPSTAIYMAPSSVGVYTHLSALANAVQADLIKKANIDVTDPNAQQAFDAALAPVLAKASKEIDYKISPRYGNFDLTAEKFAATQNAWIRLTKDQQTAANAAQPQ